MSIAEKLVTVAENVNEVYEAGKNSVGDIEDIYNNGYNDGYAKAESENPLYYIEVKAFQWYRKTFPEGFNFVLKLKDKPADCNAMLSGATGIKTATISCETTGTVSYAQMFRETDIEKIDLTNFKPTPSDLSYFAYIATKLKTISGAFDLSQCTNTKSAFAGANALEDIEFVQNTIPISIGFNNCSKLTHKSLMSILNGLKDLVSKYDITNNTPNFVEPPLVNGIYTVTGTNADDVYLSVYTDKGVTINFDYDKYSQEIINALKPGAKFDILSDIEAEGPYNYTIQKFEILYVETKQTLTLGTINRAKLEKTDEGLTAIAKAERKGWDIK